MKKNVKLPTGSIYRDNANRHVLNYSGFARRIADSAMRSHLRRVWNGQHVAGSYALADAKYRAKLMRPVLRMQIWGSNGK